MSETMPAEAADRLAEARDYLRQVGGCALLIGVETYDGLPADKQLLAGRNDVMSYWKVCRRLGYRPTEIRVLTSPRLTKDDILRAERDLAPELHAGKSEEQLEKLVGAWFSGDKPEVVLGEATRDALVEGVKWLAAKLVVTVKLDWGTGKLEKELGALPGLLVYSGHGARVGGDLALCPRDVGRALERALPFAELRALVDAGDDIRKEGTPRPADNLTVVLDCCFASAGAGQGDKATRVSTLTPGADGATFTGAEIGSRVFCAAGRDEQAYQAMLGGRWQGAFSWAFTRALEQWKTAPSGQYKKSTVSHIELLFRARMLLEALSFPQHPVLVDHIGNLPVFQHDSDATDDTSAEPDAKRVGGQMDPGNKDVRIYTFTDAVGAVAAQVWVPAATGTLNGTTYYQGSEYWQGVATSLPNSQLTVTWEDHYWSDSMFPTPLTHSFTMTRTPNWTTQNYTYLPAAPNRFVSNTTKIALFWNITYNGIVWSGSLTWWNGTGNNDTFSGLTSGVTLTGSTDYGHDFNPKHYAQVAPQ
jgi:hypothetical protein